MCGCRWVNLCIHAPPLVSCHKSEEQTSVRRQVKAGLGCYTTWLQCVFEAVPRLCLTEARVPQFVWSAQHEFLNAMCNEINKI